MHYAIDGRNVSEAEFLVSEETFEKTGHTSYIRPTYDPRSGERTGFAVYVAGEAIGRVFKHYKHASLLLTQYRNGELQEIEE
jgi:hypothetical protein